MSGILCRICAAGKPENSRIGSREPGREGVCWLAGCGVLGAGSRELGQGLGAVEQGGRERETEAGSGNTGRNASADVWVHEQESGEQGDDGVC